MDKQATIENKTSLGKRKKSEDGGNPDGLDDLDSVVVSAPRKKIQKVTHSYTVNK